MSISTSFQTIFFTYARIFNRLDFKISTVQIHEPSYLSFSSLLKLIFQYLKISKHIVSLFF